ncbi:uncharacterized protein [Ptychodera flava]|uniref:uncharacterized protein n=1 Tax=Ptychodera flava TaxID=63121 RepID=UPI003969CCDD
MLKLKPEVTTIHDKDFSGNYIAVSAMTRDERTLLTGWENGMMKLYDISSGNFTREFKVHESSNERYGDEDAVTQIELSSREQFFVTASSDRTAKLWDMASLRQVHVFKGHNNTVHTAKITGDDRYLLTAAFSEISVRVWSTGSGQQLANVIGYSPIDAVCILPKTKRVIITTVDGRFMFFKATSSADPSRTKHQSPNQAAHLPGQQPVQPIQQATQPPAPPGQQPMRPPQPNPMHHPQQHYQQPMMHQPPPQQTYAPPQIYQQQQAPYAPNPTQPGNRPQQSQPATKSKSCDIL